MAKECKRLPSSLLEECTCSKCGKRLTNSGEAVKVSIESVSLEADKHLFTDNYSAYFCRDCANTGINVIVKASQGQ